MFGFRRSGHTFYRPCCDGCDRCIPIRVDAKRFKPTASQRRAAHRNRDLRVAYTPLHFDPEAYALYRRYEVQHHGHEDTEGGENAYMSFLLEGGVRGSEISWYRATPQDSAGASGDAGGRLVANGYLDLLPQGISSVYFAWEPGEAKRSLGVYSVLDEVDYCVRTGRAWYYLGFWVPGARTMAYKANYGPAEVAIDGVWTPLDEGLRQRLSGPYIDRA